MRALFLGYLWLAYIGGVLCQDCSSEMIQDLQPAASGVGVVTLSWLSVPYNISSSFSYQIEYRPFSQSNGGGMKRVTGTNTPGRVTVNLSRLLNFTTYTVVVHLSCDQGGEGPSSTVQVTTVPSVPSASVSGLLQTNVSSTGNIHLVRLQWDPLDDTRWNGVPLFYDVSIFLKPDRDPQQTHRVHFPSTNLLLSLDSGEYGATVVAVNNVGSANTTAILEFLVGDESRSLNVADYPYFYIIIPGIIFLAFIIVITIVIFKKVRESRKQSVSYVRDITDRVNYSGFNNMMPMRNVSPPSPNTSTSLPSTIANSSPYPHAQLATRPLPLSPATPGLIPAEEFSTGHSVGGHMTSSSSAGALKMSTGANHPGPLPSLDENMEHNGGYPISRTMTDQSLGGSVFSPTSVTSVPISHAPMPRHDSGHAHHRGRSNTMGGIPSPYEVPGNTLPHELHRPSSAHPNIQQRNNGDLGGSFPPPPIHSPPPLTHSSGDVHMDDHAHQHMGGAVGMHHHHHHHPHQQQHPGGSNLPRTSPNQRSFSTSAAHGCTVNDPRLGMTSMKSEGNIPSPPDNEVSVFTQSPAGPESTVYIQPPLDSDLELQSMSSYGEAVPMGRRQSNDHGRPAHLSSHHYPSQSHYPGMVNGTLDSGEDFNRMDGGEGMVPSHMANPHDHSMKEKERAARDVASRRESMFSETSTELSITSGSEKESSPSGWDRDHKVARSDVGVPQHRHHHRRHHDRHHRSSTPPERDFQANGFV